MTPFTRILLATVAAITALAIAMIWPQSGNQGPGQSIQPPSTADIGGPFALTDHEGNTVTDMDFRGRPLLIAFGYSKCPDVCQMMLQNISEALDKIGDRAAGITPLFISFDPDRDTPEVLTEHLDNFHPAIRGLTGDAAAIEKVTKAYRVYYKKVEVTDPEDSAPDNYIMEHSSNIYLMDRNGRYAAHFSHHTKPAEIAVAVAAAIGG
jgi:protein SCO1/2